MWVDPLSNIFRHLLFSANWKDLRLKLDQPINISRSLKSINFCALLSKCSVNLSLKLYILFKKLL